jgi:DNA-binding response OmpR family regulator
MTSALICLADAASDGLQRTLLWRGDVERTLVATIEEAGTLLVGARFDIVVLDRDLPGVEELIRWLRDDGQHRMISVVVAARGDMRPSELHFLEAGANAILRLPAGAEWDQRIARLVAVPRRKAVRVPVCLELEGRTLLDVQLAHATVLNLSVTGMLLESDRPLELRTELAFSFFLPYISTPIVGRGHVVREAGSGRYGIEFDDLPLEAVEAIGRLPA